MARSGGSALEYVVITAPTAETASFYQLNVDFLSSKLKELECCQCYCISDPEGYRIGSGGGTLNALAALVEEVGRDKVLASNVAIIHSGGDSRRSPLQSVSGKAWSSLNCAHRTKARATIPCSNSDSTNEVEEEEEGDYEVNLYASPLTVLLSELSDIVARLPLRSLSPLSDSCSGSVVVASSDVLVSLEMPKSFIFPPLMRDAITVITVPECVEIAKNHGVLGGSSLSPGQGPEGEDSDVDVFHAECYLQKPSPQDMVAAGVLLASEEREQRSGEKKQMSWTQTQDASFMTLIDTGLVLACGRAFQSLIRLVEDPVVVHCTFRMLSDPPSSDTSTTAPGPAMKVAPLRLELYSDMLLALTLNDGQPNSFLSYLRRLKVHTFGGEVVPLSDVKDLNSDESDIMAAMENWVHGKSLTLYEQALVALWKVLRTCPLVGLRCSMGVFCHLGTSAELKQLFLSPNLASGTTKEAESKIYDMVRHLEEERDKKLKVFCRRYALQASVRSLVHVRSAKDSCAAKNDYDNEGCSDPSASISGSRICLINSYLALKTKSFSPVVASAGGDDVGSVLIGPDSVVESSFLHGETVVGAGCVVSGVQPALGQDLVVPGGVMVQQVPLMASWPSYASISPTAPALERQGPQGMGVGANCWGDGDCCVLLTLGVVDDVKALYIDRESERSGVRAANGGICGISWAEFFQQPAFQGEDEDGGVCVSGAKGLIRPDDLWGPDCTERSLWTAQLYPVIPLVSLQRRDEKQVVDTATSTAEQVQQELLRRRSVATWFWSICHPTSTAAAFSRTVLLSQVQEWRVTPRLSLAQLLKCGSAKGQAQWKRFLLGAFRELQDLTPPRPSRSLFCSPLSSMTAQSVSHVGAMKRMSSCECLLLSRLFANVTDLLQLIGERLSVICSYATATTVPSQRVLEQESASLCLALLLIRLCMPPSFTFTSSKTSISSYDSSEFCCWQGGGLEFTSVVAQNVSLFDERADSAVFSSNSDQGGGSLRHFPATMASLQQILNAVEATFQEAVSLSSNQGTKKSFGESVGGEEGEGKIHTVGVAMSLLLNYLTRLVDLYAPTSTLERLLRVYSGASSSLPSFLIAPANLPRLLLLLQSLAHFGILVPLLSNDEQNVVVDLDVDAMSSHCKTVSDVQITIDQGSRAIMQRVFASVAVRGCSQGNSGSWRVGGQSAGGILLERAQELIRLHLHCSTRCNLLTLAATSCKSLGEDSEPASSSWPSLPSLSSSASASAPFRIDLAGGWSDTPPITYEYSGCVVNIAVDVLDYVTSTATKSGAIPSENFYQHDEEVQGDEPMDTMAPPRNPSLHCTARFLAQPIILLTSRMKSPASFAQGGAQGGDLTSHTVTCTSLADFQTSTAAATVGGGGGGAVWERPGALLRACVMALGLLEAPSPAHSGIDPSSPSSLAVALWHRCGGKGLHLTSTSSVPVGSGLGSSSILVAVVIQAIWKLLGEEHGEGDEGKAVLVDLVAQVEQLLRTGGGWQDTCGGVYGGLKACRSGGRLPLTVAVQPLPLPPMLQHRLQQRVCLVYSGVARVARHTLLRVLAKHARQPHTLPTGSKLDSSKEELGSGGGVGAIPELINNAERLNALFLQASTSFSTSEGAAAVTAADRVVDAVAEHVRIYWEQKKDLARGTETASLRYLLSRLLLGAGASTEVGASEGRVGGGAGLCVAASACGAGAGGFVVCFLRRGVCLSQLADLLEMVNAECRKEGEGGEEPVLSLHPIRINVNGVMSESAVDVST